MMIATDKDLNEKEIGQLLIFEKLPNQVELAGRLSNTLLEELILFCRLTLILLGLLPQLIFLLCSIIVRPASQTFTRGEFDNRRKPSVY